MDLLELTIDGLPASARALSLRGDAGLSTPYVFQVSFAILASDAGFNPSDVFGKDASIVLNADDGAPRARFHGVVAATEFVHALSQHALFRVVIRPRAWQLSLNERSRVWVDKKMPDVIEDVFKANGLRSGDDYRLSLSRSYPVQEHVGQYHESDWDFVSRRMEREGIFYYFEQGEDRETLVLTDDAASLARSPEAPVRFFATSPGDASAVEAMHWFSSRRQMVAEQARVADYNYLTPTVAIAAATAVAEGGVGVVSVFGANHPTPAEAKRLAKVRAEERAAPQTVYQGRGRVFELQPGFRFELDGHPLASFNRELLAVTVRHTAVQSGAGDFLAWLDLPGMTREQAIAGSYTSEVSAIGADVAYRAPCRTPVPRVLGLESGRVDGALDDDYAQLDEHGRYRVQILFDESGLPDGKASTWVRMVQPHGGNPEGFHFPLCKGTEVLLSFIGGDPDRPVIVGAGPDAARVSTVTGQNHTQNVIMTGGSNRIEIEDQDGSQSIGLYSPPQNSTLHLGAHHGPYHQGHNFTLTTDGNGLIHTGGERNITVGADQTEDVIGDLTETYHANQTTHVMAAFTETIDGGATQTIDGGETRTITGGVTETIDGGETRTITGGQTETVSGSVTRTVSANVTDTIGANVTRTVGGSQTDTIAGTLSQTVAGAVSVTTPGTYNLTSGGTTTFTAPGGMSIIAPGGIRIVDVFFTKIGTQTKRDAFSLKMGTMGAKFDESGVFIGFAGTKAEAMGYKNERNAVLIEKKGNNLRAGGPEEDTGAIELQNSGGDVTV